MVIHCVCYIYCIAYTTFWLSDLVLPSRHERVCAVQLSLQEEAANRDYWALWVLHTALPGETSAISSANW